MRCYLGLDPGLGGAVGVLYDSETWAEVWDTPVTAATIRGRTRREYDLRAMWTLLNTALRWRGDGAGQSLAVIEAVSPMPREGVVSASRSGYGAGVWHGLLTAIGIPYRIVHPATWKRAEGLIGRDKAASRLEAQRRFPSVELGRVKDHGRAEALLLADFARKQQW